MLGRKQQCRLLDLFAFASRTSLTLSPAAPCRALSRLVCCSRLFVVMRVQAATLLLFNETPELAFPEVQEKLNLQVRTACGFPHTVCFGISCVQGLGFNSKRGRGLRV